MTKDEERYFKLKTLRREHLRRGDDEQAAKIREIMREMVANNLISETALKIAAAL